MKKVKIRVFCCFHLLFACLAPLSLHGQDDNPFTRLFDTGVASAQSPADEVIATRAGWTLVPEDKVDHPFSGDAVLLNDKLAVMLRKEGQGAEVYSKTANGWKHRATVGHLGTSSSVLESLAGLKIIENSSGAAMVEAGFKNTRSAALRFRLTTGEAILEMRPGAGAEFVDVSTRTRYVVVPDYFGDDMVFGGEAFRGLFLPAENFCLNLLDGGEAMVMSVWQSNAQDVRLAPTGLNGVGTNYLSHQIRCLSGKSVWLAFLESPGIWQAGNLSDKESWKPPFPAKWRKSLVRENNAADSWDVDRGPSPEQTTGKHHGPLIVYPIDRSAATPLTTTCPTDVMRNTLGVGPCQYILAVEGLAAEGDPTPNSVMNWVEKQFEQKKEKKLADDIQERLQIMVEHVGHARGKIEQYAEFAGQVRKLLANQPGVDPFRLIVDDWDRCITNGLVQTASPERAKQLALEVSALIGKQNPLAACRSLGERLRSVGAVQDSALAKCRMAVRRLKQQSRERPANPPQNAGLAQEIQRLTEHMLQEKSTSSGNASPIKP